MAVSRRTTLAGMLGACAASPTLAAPAPAGLLVYIACRGAPAEQGIYAARMDPRTGDLAPLGRVAQLGLTNWVAVAGGVVYFSADGAAQTDPSRIGALRPDRATGVGQVLAATPTGGLGTTQFVADPRSRSLIVAHFGSAQVAALPLNPDGSVGATASIQQQEGKGPHPRQASAHAHGVALHPGGRFVGSADFGADKLYVYGFDPRTRALTPVATEAFPAGATPRHVAFDRTGRRLYVLTELSAEICTFDFDPRTGAVRLRQKLPTFSPSTPGDRSAAEVAVSEDGRHLYVSNRAGENSIVAYRIDGATGELTEVQREPSGGRTPWNFAFTPGGRWMLVANRDSNAIQVLSVDPASGRLAATGKSVSVPAPLAVAALQT